jgi:uncharacterized membrane protein YqjE
MSPSPHDDSGLLASLRRVAGTALALGLTRLELLGAEIEEEQLRLLRFIGWSALALLMLQLGLIFLALWIVVAWWDEHRLLALGLATAAFLVAAAGAAWAARQHGRQGSKLFSGSFAELARDREVLKDPP